MRESNEKFYYIPGGGHISISYMHSAIGGGAVLENQSLRA